jgi:excisionase family DNA binding protein
LAPLRRPDCCEVQRRSIHALARSIAVIREACRMTGIGCTKINELIQEGEIEVIKVGTMTLVPVASLEAFLASHRMH